MSAEDEIEHVNLLKNWLKDEPFVRNNSLYKVAILLMPFWITSGIVATILWIPWQLGIFWLLVPAYFLRTTLEKVNETHLRTTHAEKMLALYGRLIGHIETENFQSEKLQSLKTVFTKNDKVASVAIRRLSYIISQLNLRYNPFAVLINLLCFGICVGFANSNFGKQASKTNFPIGLMHFRNLKHLVVWPLSATTIPNGQCLRLMIRLNSMRWN